MSNGNKPSKETSNQGLIVVIFILLFIIGGGAAYLLISREGNNQDSQKPLKENITEKVVEAKSLVENPPPLPEDTPTLQVMDAGTNEGDNTSGEKKRVGTGGINGTIDPKVASDFIRSNTNKITACYEKELKINNLLMGVVKTQIIVNTDGSVASVNFLSDSVGSPNLKKCIRSEIQTWKFPKPEGGRAEIQFPFRFEPKQK